MAVNTEAYQSIKKELDAKQVTLVAVSKTKPVEDILALYDLGQRDFGENYVQELVDKQAQLPKDIRWHFIGHLQRNKVKYIVPFVHMIHGVDSFKLFDEINSQASKINREVKCLFQVHISDEETKFGFSGDELHLTLNTIKKYNQMDKYKNVEINGLMGMASFSDDMEKVRGEFRNLKILFDQCTEKFTTLSMGMSGDYKIAVEEGSTMVRVGSLLFGARNYAK
ncbi:YggS family pyridoxal phosphate-dependent enzyme [Lacibacter luteus]|uniref:Pyridoxal phosphate homeostasis protein n=1 Tax=Lacibacter luteus TaxID=2508719 RepID=A0A4Q1CLI7_9BACT|nr:YggS family pyridoxal phosphate-dependent enzyme [Lacibacter luteus]RXK61449.1 YggS family pyridoxal phosphate-dependent enzyme [Lacibacter luteus]